MGYHPGIGQFAQRDPIGYADGMNLLLYERGSPVNLLDPMGLEAELPPGVSAPSNGSISGPVTNNIQQIIDEERRKLLDDLSNLPPDDISDKVAELKDRQADYKCTITVKSIAYVRTLERTSERVVQQATATGRPRNIRVSARQVFDEFSVTAHLECTCPIREGDYSWVIEVRRGDPRLTEHGPWEGPLPPPPADRDINRPREPIPLDPPRDPIVVGP
jgi:hypothetical protein